MNAQHLVSEHLDELASALVVDQSSKTPKLSAFGTSRDPARFDEQPFGEGHGTINEYFFGRVLHANIEHLPSSTKSTGDVLRSYLFAP